ncbi:MAG: phasin family protein [Methanolobus sp.]
MKDATDITEVMRKVGLFGIGLWALTEEKIQDITDDLIENGEIKKEEGKKFVREVIDEQKKQKEEIENKITSKVQDTFKKADVATKDEVQDLKDTIKSLEDKIDKLIHSGEKTFKLWQGGVILSKSDNLFLTVSKTLYSLTHDQKEENPEASVNEWSFLPDSPLRDILDITGITEPGKQSNDSFIHIGCPCGGQQI